MSATQFHPVLYIMSARFASRPAGVAAQQCQRAGLSLEQALCALRLSARISSTHRKAI